MHSDNETYADQVATANYPNETIVPLDNNWVDERGEIKNLILGKINSVARITSKANTLRANHYHRTDWHYTFLEAGKMLYFERPVGATEIPRPIAILPGTLFFTPPLKEHAMWFIEDSIIYTFAKNTRTHKNHEDDVVRVMFVTEQYVRYFVQ